MEKRLRLVVDNSCFNSKKPNLKKNLLELFTWIENIFTPKTEKIIILKEIIMNIYKDYEISTGIIDEPYFLKAERKISKIIKERKVDYYYTLLKKFR